MLTPVEQAVMAKLSIFRGGFTREAAEQVAGANLRVLLALVNKSFVQRQAENGRVTIHELLRQFAAAQRQQLDPENETALTHCRYFAQVAAQEVQRSLSFSLAHLQRKYLPDFDNLRRAWEVALTHGLTTELANLVRMIILFSLEQGLLPMTTIPQTMQSLRQRSIPESDKVMLHLQLNEFFILRSVGDMHLIKERFLAYLPLVEKHGDPELHYWTYDRLFNCRELWTDQAILEVWGEKARQASLKMQNEDFGKAIEMYDLEERTFGHPPNANVLERLENLKTYFEPKYGNSYFFFAILSTLQYQYRGMGLFDKAVQVGSQALNLAKQWQSLGWIGLSSMILADTFWEMGLPDEGRKIYLDDLEWNLAIGQTWQALGYLRCRAAYHSKWFGGPETAVSVMAMVHYHPDTPLNFLQSLELELPPFRESMDPAMFAAAWEKGRTMGFETTVSIVKLALTTGEVE